MKYKPKFSNVNDLYDEVASDLKEAVALEERAVDRFAEILDNWVQAIIEEPLADLRFMLHAGKNPDDVWLNAYSENLDSMYHDGHNFDLWKILDDLTDLCDNDRTGLHDAEERARAVADRLRKLADRVENP